MQPAIMRFRSPAGATRDALVGSVRAGVRGDDITANPESDLRCALARVAGQLNDISERMLRGQAREDDYRVGAEIIARAGGASSAIDRAVAQYRARRPS